MLKNMKKKMEEIWNKVDKTLDKMMGLNGHYEPIAYEYVDENGKVFGTSNGFYWVKD